MGAKFWRIEPDQDAWYVCYRRNRAPECGTTYCIAGYVCEVAGLDTNTYAHDAADLLGIKYNGYGEEAGDLLFHANNSIEDVRRIAEDIAGERL